MAQLFATGIYTTIWTLPFASMAVMVLEGVCKESGKDLVNTECFPHLGGGGHFFATAKEYSVVSPP